MRPAGKLQLKAAISLPLVGLDTYIKNIYLESEIVVLYCACCTPPKILPIWAVLTGLVTVH